MSICLVTGKRNCKGCQYASDPELFDSLCTRKDHNKIVVMDHDMRKIIQTIKEGKGNTISDDDMMKAHKWLRIVNK